MLLSGEKKWYTLGKLINCDWPQFVPNILYSAFGQMNSLGINPNSGPQNRGRFIESILFAFCIFCIIIYTAFSSSDVHI